MRTVRIVTAVIIALGAAAMFTGCTSTHSTCQHETCTITLEGSGANLDPDGYTVELESADGRRASFTIEGQAATCSDGEVVEAAGYSATCTRVGSDLLIVEVT